MTKTEKQVVLTINDRGIQASRGSYSHFISKDASGIVQGVNVDKQPGYCDCYKRVNLSNQFVQGALDEPPTEVKGSHHLAKIWNKIPEDKRITIHVKNYVHSLYPNHKGFTINIIK